MTKGGFMSKESQSQTKMDQRVKGNYEFGDETQNQFEL